MQMTNRFNLPSLVIKPMEAPTCPQGGRYRVTELIDSPLIRKLKQIYWADLTWDWADFLEADLGTACHARMEVNASDTCLVEHHMEMEVGGVKVHGTCDCIDGDVIWDYKFAKQSYLRMHFEQLTQQVNLYALMARREGKSISRLVGAIRLKNWDWKMVAFGHGVGDYPPGPYEQVEIPLWSEQQQMEFLQRRVAAHTDLHLHPCTPEERWLTPAVFAVMSKDNTRAKKLCDSREAAESYIKDNNVREPWIQERPGCALRCMLWPDGRHWCPVRDVCPFVRSSP